MFRRPDSVLPHGSFGLQLCVLENLSAESVLFVVKVFESACFDDLVVPIESGKSTPVREVVTGNQGEAPFVAPQDAWRVRNFLLDGRILIKLSHQFPQHLKVEEPAPLDHGFSSGCGRITLRYDGESDRHRSAKCADEASAPGDPVPYVADGVDVVDLGENHAGRVDHAVYPRQDARVADTQWWVPLASTAGGALIALSGTWLSGLSAAAREERQWRRQRADKLHDVRAQLYLDLMEFTENLLQVVHFDPAEGSSREPKRVPDVLHPARLAARVKLYGDRQLLRAWENVDRTYGVLRSEAGWYGADTVAPAAVRNAIAAIEELQAKSQAGIDEIASPDMPRLDG